MIPYHIYEKHNKIATDSRKIEADSLFIAIHGEHFNGNLFAIEALKRGAAYAVVDDESIVSDNWDYANRLIVVKDTLKSLQLLAREHRRRLNIPIIAISGSNGKTTTKELLHCALSQKYRCHATRGNLNNHLGVPLTLLEMDTRVEVAIIEMGANHCGEIAALCAIAEPNAGLLTNVGRAHLEGFGGEQGVRRGKGELFDYLVENRGEAFIASQNNTLCTMAAERPTLKVVKYSYSLASGVKHQLEGEYNLMNIAAAIAVADQFGAERQKTIEAIARYTPNNNRSQRITTERNTLIVDCYNANPSSMQLAIANAASEKVNTLILGQMLELGDYSKAEHAAIIEQALAIDNVKIMLVGAEFNLATKCERVSLFPSRKELIAKLQQEPIVGAKILIKGSHSVGLESIIEYL